MPTTRRLAVDLVVVRNAEGKILTTLAWGDEVVVLGDHEGGLAIEIRQLRDLGDRIEIVSVPGFIRKPSASTRLTIDDVLKAEDATGDDGTRGVLRVDFVDVQQGDGAVLETPNGQVVLIDGGDNQLFARYLAARFGGTTVEEPQPIAAIVVTHGDADHFEGLTRIHASETHRERPKRLFIQPERVFHNGLVKRPSSRPARDLLGPTAEGENGGVLLVGLEDDLREVDDSEMNRPFQSWKRALLAWSERGALEMQRLEHGMNAAFDFLAQEGVEVRVLGPLTVEHEGRPALPFLGEPIPKLDRQSGDNAPTMRGLSASHAVNGHSVILHVTFGRIRLLFAGDLNEPAEQILVAEHDAGRIDLTAEVFKVPHHGSADFSVPFLKAVSPVVSVISSGDESPKKEFIHPRASLVGALSRQGRAEVEEPLVFVTELAAFFQVEGWVMPDQEGVTHKTQVAKRTDEFFAFSRRAFGIVKVRTDGERLLVYTFSGKEDMKEAYAFRVEGDGRIVPDRVRKC